MQRIGDHLARQHLFDGQGLAVKHCLRVGQSVGALVDGNLGHRALVIVVLRGITLGNHRVAGVLAHVPIRQVKLGFRCAKGRTVPTEAHGARHPGRVLVRTKWRHACRDDAQHRLAQAQLDRRRSAPDHAHRGATAQVHHFSEVQAQAQVFGGHGRNKYRGFVKVRAVDYQPVEVRGLEPGIA